jgi:hypothetical protein
MCEALLTGLELEVIDSSDKGDSNSTEPEGDEILGCSFLA